MEESQNEVTPQTQEPTVQEKQSTEVRDASAVLAKNKELLDYNAKMKAQLKELQDFKKSVETKELESKGQYEQIVQNLKEELNSTKEQLTTTQQTHEYEKFKSKVKSVAKQSDCVDPDLLFNLMSEDQQKAIIANGEFDKEVAKSMMEEIKKNYSHIRLFDDKKVNHNPSIVTATKPAPKTGNKAGSIAEMLVNKK